MHPYLKLLDTAKALRNEASDLEAYAESIRDKALAELREIWADIERAGVCDPYPCKYIIVEGKVLGPNHSLDDPKLTPKELAVLTLCRKRPYSWREICLVVPFSDIGPWESRE